MKSIRTAAGLVVGVAALAAVSGTAFALDLGFSNNRLNITGMVRQEMAAALFGNENPFNQYGNPYNGRQPPSTTFGGLPLNQPRVFNDGLMPAPGTFFYGPIKGLPTYFDDEPTWNVMNTRLEIDVQYAFSDNLNGYVKLRAYGDGTDTFSSAYDKTDFFGVPFYGDRRANVLEVNGEQWMLDFPAAYLDYHQGSLWVRAGNQQIAWGEAIFFRVADVVNGLDLRRHSFLDVAGEEYADERVASPGLRVSYTFKNNMEIDAFVQKFQPTIYGNENSPYNVIASQFVIDQRPGFDDADSAVNFGGRLNWPVTDSFTVQAFGVSRRNPDGVFRWSAVPADAPGAVCAANFAAFGVDPALGCTPFQADGRGVYSAQEWFTYAGKARLNGVGGLQSAYADFPAADAIRAAFGLPVVTDKTTALANLDAFYSLAPLRGWLAREYKREEIFGVGANYIVTANPESFFDQLVIRGEVSYTPDKKFTNPSLSADYIESDEVVASAVLEKYHRFSDAFPATFMVLEWLFKSDSDMFGRHLSGMGNAGWTEADGQPNGIDTFNAFAFAMQQPFPNLIWRADLAVLVDVKGGWLVQPGVRYKPSASWQFDLYGNFIGSNGNNNDVLETFDFADELFARVSYFF
ncbi:MAG: hypothetical protein IT495_22015 [Gammaproteobacteria bacterium]|nr:hypothetical protein [Gammaproteobacteria bacterium]